jgi:amphi-Trp domain-containing protein
MKRLLPGIAHGRAALPETMESHCAGDERSTRRAASHLQESGEAKKTADVLEIVMKGQWNSSRIATTTHTEEPMSEKHVLMDIKESVLRYDAAVLLRKLADGLAQGTIVTDNGNVEIGEWLKIECKGKAKEKTGGSKGSIEIKVSWFTPNP